MALELVEVRHVNMGDVEHHLDAGEVAAYVDRATTAEVRSRLQAHLAVCDACRYEVMEISRIAGTLTGRNLRRRVWKPAAAVAALAAVAMLVVVLPRTDRRGEQHREAAVTTTIAPRALSPIGLVDSAAALVWSAVPRADGYRVRLFDAAGSVLWDNTTNDTSVALPLSVKFQAGQPHYWKVEANTGFDRKAASELIEFSIRRGRQ